MSAATKGWEGGPCNLTACQRPGARWWNTSTRAWYCDDCAAAINRSAVGAPLLVTRVSLPNAPAPAMSAEPTDPGRLAARVAELEAAVRDGNRLVCRAVRLVRFALSSVGGIHDAGGGALGGEQWIDDAKAWSDIARALATPPAAGAATDGAEGLRIPTEPIPDTIVSLRYRNWRGEVADRRVRPLWLWFGSTEWHMEPQALLAVQDVEKGDARRDLVVRDILAFEQPIPFAAPPAAPTPAPAHRRCTWHSMDTGAGCRSVEGHSGPHLFDAVGA